MPEAGATGKEFGHGSARPVSGPRSDGERVRDFLLERENTPEFVDVGSAAPVKREHLPMPLRG